MGCITWVGLRAGIFRNKEAFLQYLPAFSEKVTILATRKQQIEQNPNQSVVIRPARVEEIVTDLLRFPKAECNGLGEAAGGLCLHGSISGKGDTIAKKNAGPENDR